MYKPFSPNLQFLNNLDQNQVDPHPGLVALVFPLNRPLISIVKNVAECTLLKFKLCVGTAIRYFPSFPREPRLVKLVSKWCMSIGC